ncbi:alpha/beta hydrolase [Rhizobium sp. FKL33]|uniref:alpha/beta fold hydrolase n=1 Tax=Rhizobium sp. FKL33 TaxID=2562307 RepID=UPI0010BFB6F1|nr:alpha/beta hydrolase [Rhizobium sp. FKL33]
MPSILRATPDNLPPDNHVAGFFDSFDGAKLRYAIFRAAQSPAAGTVILLHGRNEAIEKYYETIRDLTEAGLWVATFDWRGQGGSPRLHQQARKGHLRRFGDLERDLDAFIEKVVLPDAKMPFFIVAHSMGALVALRAAPWLSNRIDRMALCAPFVGSAGIGIPNGLLKLLANASHLTGLGAVQFSKDVLERPFEGNPLTSDIIRFRRNRGIQRAHPDLFIGPPTASWIASMIRAIETVSRMDHLHRIEIPTLVIAPSADKIVPYPYFEALSQRFRAGKLITIAGAEHELLQERDIFRDQTLAAIKAFIPGSDSDPLIYSGE